MLNTCLKHKPYTKFIILKDNVNNKANEILSWIINKREISTEIIFCEFECNRNLNKRLNLTISKHDFIGDLSKDEIEDDEKKIIKLSQNDAVIIIDSLAHMVFKFGKEKTFQILKKIKRTARQIVAILHMDLFKETDDVFNYFNHLSTLSVTLEPTVKTKLRVSYTYKKSEGKIINEVEIYAFENEELICHPEEKLDPNNLLQEIVIMPETLTTFKIDLNERDKESRDQFTLPYLPKQQDTPKESGGTIFYQFDDVDDWDEEDPDDDLDI